MGDSIRQIKHGAILSYMTIAFNIATGLLYTPWMIRQIGDSHYALYVMATSVIGMLMMDFGIGAATGKFIAEYTAKKEYGKANEYIANSFAIFGAISLVLLIILSIAWFFLGALYDNLAPGELEIFKKLYLIVASYSILLFPFTPLNSILGGSGSFFELKLTILLQRMLNVFFIIGALLGGMGVFALVLVHALTGLIMTVLQLYFVNKMGKVQISWNLVSYRVIKKIAGFSLWVLVSQIFTNLLINLTPAVIGASLSTAEVTLFSLALTLERYVLAFSSGINGFFLPKVSSIMTDTDNKAKRITELMIKVGKLTLSIVGGIISAFVVIGRGFVMLWMGDGYGAVFVNALILMVPLLFLCSQEIGYIYLMAEGEIKYQSIADVVTSILGFSLLFFGTKAFGIVGATLGLTISTLLNSLIINVIYAKRLHIDIISFYKSTYLKWILCAAASIIAGNLIVHFVRIHRWMDLIVDGALMVIVYGMITAFWYYNVSERKELLSILKR